MSCRNCRRFRRMKLKAIKSLGSLSASKRLGMDWRLVKNRKVQKKKKTNLNGFPWFTKRVDSNGSVSTAPIADNILITDELEDEVMD